MGEALWCRYTGPDTAQESPEPQSCLSPEGEASWPGARQAPVPQQGPSVQGQVGSGCQVDGPLYQVG